MSIDVTKITEAYIEANDPYKLAQILMNGINYTVDVRLKELRVTEAPWKNIAVSETDLFKIRVRILEIFKKRKSNV